MKGTRRNGEDEWKDALSAGEVRVLMGFKIAALRIDSRELFGYQTDARPALKIFTVKKYAFFARLRPCVEYASCWTRRQQRLGYGVERERQRLEGSPFKDH